MLYAGVTLARAGASQNRQSVTDYEFLGGVTIPTGTLFEGTEIGGLSGLVYDPSRSLYYAIADDRSPAASLETFRPADFGDFATTMWMWFTASRAWGWGWAVKLRRIWRC